jgi:hypothetical protein
MRLARCGKVAVDVATVATVVAAAAVEADGATISGRVEY